MNLSDLISETRNHRERLVLGGNALDSAKFQWCYIELGKIAQDYNRSYEVRQRALDAMHELAFNDL